MKAILLFGIVVTMAAPVLAQPNYHVDLLSQSRQYLYVDDEWNSAAECIEAKISVSEDTSGPKLDMKAYFYSGEGKLIYTARMPSTQGNDNGETIKPPTALKRGRKYSVYFGIPKGIRSGAAKWKRVIVVFGTGGTHSARIYPKDDMTKFDFPEKATVPASESK